MKKINTNRNEILILIPILDNYEQHSRKEEKEKKN